MGGRRDHTTEGVIDSTDDVALLDLLWCEKERRILRSLLLPGPVTKSPHNNTQYSIHRINTGYNRVLVFGLVVCHRNF